MSGFVERVARASGRAEWCAGYLSQTVILVISYSSFSEIQCDGRSHLVHANMEILECRFVSAHQSRLSVQRHYNECVNFFGIFGLSHFTI